MGTWYSLRVAFVLGSLFMVLLIAVYWDDIGGFSLYPLQELKHESHDPLLQTTTGPLRPTSTSSAQGVLSFAVSTAASSHALVPEKKGGAFEDYVEEEEEERSRTALMEQEARKRRITDICSGKDDMEFPGRTRTFEQIPNRELDHLIVDDTHKIIYCYVPKVTAPCPVCMCVTF